MTDYEQLVNDLRHADDLSADHKLLGVCARAADAIEELRKVNRELTELYEDAVRNLPYRGEWIKVNPMVDSVQCSVCGGQLFSAELETPYCPYCEVAKDGE